MNTWETSSNRKITGAYKIEKKRQSKKVEKKQLQTDFEEVKQKCQMPKAKPKEIYTCI